MFRYFLIKFEKYFVLYFKFVVYLVIVLCFNMYWLIKVKYMVLKYELSVI